MEQLFATYGALGIFLGAAVEGQTAVIIGGVLARQNLIPLWVVLASAAAGSAIVDHVLFVVGRRFRSSRLVVRMSARPAFRKALGLVERFPVTFLMGFRFIYGLRAAGPVAIGLSTVSTAMFTILNIVSAVFWAAVFTGLGYLFGHALEQAMGRTTPLQRTALAVGVMVLALCAFALARLIIAARRRGRTTAED